MPPRTRAVAVCQALARRGRGHWCAAAWRYHVMSNRSMAVGPPAASLRLRCCVAAPRRIREYDCAAQTVQRRRLQRRDVPPRFSAFIGSVTAALETKPHSTSRDRLMLEQPRRRSVLRCRVDQATSAARLGVDMLLAPCRGWRFFMRRWRPATSTAACLRGRSSPGTKQRTSICRSWCRSYGADRPSPMISCSFDRECPISYACDHQMQGWTTDGQPTGRAAPSPFAGSGSRGGQRVMEF
jgi:hypothetical protein